MKTKRARSFWLLASLTAALAVAALALGRYPAPLIDVFRSLLGLDGAAEVTRALVLQVRLPRVVAALCVGANLSAVGAVFQGMFRNPLVDSGILGISSGAAFGAAVSLLVVPSAAAVQGGAFAFAAVAVALVGLIGWRFGSSPLVLIIGGVLVSALFNSLLGLVKYVADPLSTLPAITYWLLGSLSGTNWSSLWPLLAVTLPGLLFLLIVRWRLNLLTLSETEAMSLGVSVRTFRWVVLLVGTVLVAVSVALSGMIGWIGLVVPHLSRAWGGPDHTRMIPSSIVLGAASLLVLDTVSRTAMTSEIPLGILTGLIGVPAFLVFFWRFLRAREEVR